jgi:hypothetical protein
VLHGSVHPLNSSSPRTLDSLPHFALRIRDSHTRLLIKGPARSSDTQACLHTRRSARQTAGRGPEPTAKQDKLRRKLLAEFLDKLPNKLLDKLRYKEPDKELNSDLDPLRDKLRSKLPDEFPVKFRNKFRGR